MLSVLYAIARPSVCLSVCHKGDHWISQKRKTVEVRIMQFYTVAPSFYFLRHNFVQKFRRVPPPSGGVKHWWGEENKLFSSFMRQYLENGTRYDQSAVTLLMTNRKLHIMCLRFAPLSMTLNDLELL